MDRSLSFDAMEIDSDANGTNGTDGNIGNGAGTDARLCDDIAVETDDVTVTVTDVSSPTMNMESPPPRREPPPLDRPIRPSIALFDETDRTALDPESSGSFVTSHRWQQLRRGHHFELEHTNLDLESDLENELVISHADGHTTDTDTADRNGDTNMGMIVPSEFETESTRGVPNNTDHDETHGGSVYDSSGPPWLPIEHSESEYDESQSEPEPDSSNFPHGSRYVDEDETIVFIRFGFHYCEECIPVSDPPTAQCSTCRAPLRCRRLVRGPLEGFHEYRNYPGPRYFHYARHRCNTCWLTGVCDTCGYFLRDFRPE